MAKYRNRYRIESNRRRGYDYSLPGYYFITLCVKNRKYLYGNVLNRQMQLNEFDIIVQQCWDDFPNHYPNFIPDLFIVMPNHLHAIIKIAPVETGFEPVSTNHGVSEFVRAVKSFSAHRINELRNSPGVPVWQPGFHDHIVRIDDELPRIRRYIADNPLKWRGD